MLCQKSFIWITLWEGRWVALRRAQVALPGAVWGGCCCQTRCCRKLCCWTRMTLLLQMEPLFLPPDFIQLSVCLATWAEQCLQLGCWMSERLRLSASRWECSHISVSSSQGPDWDSQCSECWRRVPKKCHCKCSWKVIFFYSLWFLRIFFFSSLKPRSGSSDEQKGRVLGVCSCLSVLLLPQVGHLGFMVTLVWSFNLLLQQAPTALRVEAELRVRLCALCSSAKITPVTRRRESKRNFVTQC